MSIHFTSRDIAALEELGELGLMTTDMIFERHYRTERPNALKNCQQRLRQFKDEAGIIDSLPLIINTPKGIRKIPDARRLTIKGADVIEDITGRRPLRPASSDSLSPSKRQPGK